MNEIEVGDIVFVTGEDDLYWDSLRPDKNLAHTPAWDFLSSSDMGNSCTSYLKSDEICTIVGKWQKGQHDARNGQTRSPLRFVQVLTQDSKLVFIRERAVRRIVESGL